MPSSTHDSLAVIERAPVLPKRGITSFGREICVVCTMRELGVGQSFKIDEPAKRNSIYATAHRLKIKVKTTKEGEKLRVTRV